MTIKMNCKALLLILPSDTTATNIVIMSERVIFLS